MKIIDVQILGLDLLRVHGLLFQGWKIKFSRAKTLFGSCDYQNKTVFISRELAELNKEKYVKDVILHEIAHVFVPTEWHGKVWYAKARSIGCTGTRCYSKLVITPEGRFVYICEKCKKEIRVFRRFKRDYACKSCCKRYNRGRFSEKYVINEVKKM